MSDPLDENRTAEIDEDAVELSPEGSVFSVSLTEEERLNVPYEPETTEPPIDPDEQAREEAREAIEHERDPERLSAREEEERLERVQEVTERTAELGREQEEQAALARHEQGQKDQLAERERETEQKFAEDERERQEAFNTEQVAEQEQRAREALDEQDRQRDEVRVEQERQYEEARIEEEDRRSEAAQEYEEQQELAKKEAERQQKLEDLKGEAWELEKSLRVGERAALDRAANQAQLDILDYGVQTGRETGIFQVQTKERFGQLCAQLESRQSERWNATVQDIEHNQAHGITVVGDRQYQDSLRLNLQGLEEIRDDNLRILDQKAQDLRDQQARQDAIAQHEYQMSDLAQVRDDLRFQQEAAGREMDKLGLDGKQQITYLTTELESNASILNQKYVDLTAERGTAADGPERQDREMHWKMYEESREQCRPLATAQEQAQNQELLENYASIKLSGLSKEEAGTKLTAYEQQLNEQAPANVERRIDTLVEQHFPEISQNSLAIEGQDRGLERS